MPKPSRTKNHPTSFYGPGTWPAWLLLGGAWLIARLPLRAVVWIGRYAGVAVYWLGGSRRHITEVNVRLCFPELNKVEQAQLAEASFVHTAIGAIEIMLPWLNPRRDLRNRISIHGLEHLRAAAAAGRGVLLVGGHFSALDIISQGLSAAVDMDVMYRANKNPVFEWLQVTGRRRYFAGVVERRDTRQTLKRLKAGRILWYAADQDYGAKHSVFAPFFGVSTATITATARLARFNRSPVVFMSHFRDLDTLTWSIHFSPAIDGFPCGDDIEDATRINRIVEEAVREHPEQYLWMHRRFKTRPPGDPSFY